jgi:hypothetical protein
MLKEKNGGETTVNKLFLQAVGGLIGTKKELVGIKSPGSKPQ